MVQIGSRVDICAECHKFGIVGEFWNVEPRYRVFWCAGCLEKMAAGVRAAATRLNPDEAKVP